MNDVTSRAVERCNIIIREINLQKLWSEEFLRGRVLPAFDGQNVKILSPGRWNKHAGPDFTGAVLNVNGIEMVGDVEIHRNTGDWFRHGHHMDPAYSNVKMHLSMSDMGEKILNAKGDRVIQITLEDMLSSEELEMIADYSAGTSIFSPLWEPTQCEINAQRLTAEEITDRFKEMGWERIFEKSARFSTRVRAVGYEQVIYEGLFDISGYSLNRYQMKSLAVNLPLAKLRSVLLPFPYHIRKTVAEAIFLGMARMLPGQDINWKDSSFETELRAREIEKFWRRFRTEFNHILLPAGAFKNYGTRPASNPGRSLAGLASFLAYYTNRNLFKMFLDIFVNEKNNGRMIEKEVGRILNPAIDSYWTNRIKYEPALGRSYDFFGKERITRFIGNLLVPIFLNYICTKRGDSLNKKIIRIVEDLESHPHKITRFIMNRLPLGSNIKQRLPYLREQGMIRFYEKNCNLQRCDDCLKTVQYY